ncbi:hypothetical protein XENOCAPTIV_021175 [Xenoophorus captivus]|uniref:NADH dehydrogenase subunit 5 n=1 Tax=Xenoophorus captivus TaxID=1517983 RepID=A0ABV0SJA4_9TELE
MFFQNWLAAKKMFCSIKIFLSSFLSCVSSPSFFSHHHLSHSLFCLSLISDPFFMHYSITLTPIYSALPLPIFHKHSLSFFFCSFLPRLPMLHNYTIQYFCLTSFYYPFVFSPVTSPHTKDFYTYLLLASNILCLSTLSNWLFKECHVHLVSMLPIVLFYNTIEQMSAKVISSKCK